MLFVVIESEKEVGWGERYLKRLSISPLLGILIYIDTYIHICAHVHTSKYAFYYVYTRNQR